MLRMGDIAGAERALAIMEQKGVAADVVSYSTVIDAYAKKGDIAGAKRALARMKENGVGAEGGGVCFSSFPWVCPGVNFHGYVSGGRLPCDLSCFRVEVFLLGVLVPTGSSGSGWGRRWLVFHFSMGLSRGQLPWVCPGVNFHGYVQGSIPWVCPGVSFHGSLVMAAFLVLVFFRVEVVSSRTSRGCRRRRRRRRRWRGGEGEGGAGGQRRTDSRF